VKNILFHTYSHLEIFKEIFIKIFQDFFLYAELNFRSVLICKRHRQTRFLTRV
jgi:hypothetical protein